MGCNRNLQGYYAACATEWQDEIFVNCMDAEVVGDDAAPSPPVVPGPSPTAQPVAPGAPPSARCAPVGDCGSQGWCNQDTYASWCSGQSAGCPAPFCKSEEEEEEREATPNPVQSPVPNPVPAPSSTERCVATLESYYTDASTWEPYCKNVGDLGTCPEPMCRMTTSLVAIRRKHKFLSAVLLQTKSDIDRGTHVSTEL